MGWGWGEGGGRGGWGGGLRYVPTNVMKDAAASLCYTSHIDTHSQQAAATVASVLVEIVWAVACKSLAHAKHNVTEHYVVHHHTCSGIATFCHAARAYCTQGQAVLPQFAVGKSKLCQC